MLTSERGSGLGRVTADKLVGLVPGSGEAFGLRGRSAEQRIALNLLLDPDVGIVSLDGRAGTGKSALALCPCAVRCALCAVPLRCAPGSKPSWSAASTAGWWPSGRCTRSGVKSSATCQAAKPKKMAPGGQAVFDTLETVTTREVIEEVVHRGLLEVPPLTHIRGRSRHDAS